MKYEKVAVLIHTFLRDDLMYRCVESVEKHLPGARIYLSDGGYLSTEKAAFYDALKERGHWVQHYDEYNIWWRKVFNQKAAIVSEEFILKVDDDFYFTEESNLPRLTTLMQMYPYVGLLGARVYHEHRKEDSPYIYKVVGEENGKYVLDCAETSYIGCTPADFVPDFWIARTHLFNFVGMDGTLRPAQGGHEKFFTEIYELGQKDPEMMDSMQVGYTREVVAFHEKSQQSAEYKKARSSGMADYEKVSRVIKPNKKCS